ncbi:FKBP-type peptidyl-prolyl cis-trans isomerase [Pseudoalteromonas sp. T1lg88]|uniref:FKBP-type peptidyl-prolyl cis-trans isomerase n=1 Tax=Pseudoalteromonas sp. T1lg88 TaxID=2077104 RepID=UPI000CF67FA3|nr:FKBP-type peptidyl-prolyl cis-trans isomerase [Pseudoalteromonas sp. T1lg88]
MLNLILSAIILVLLVLTIRGHLRNRKVAALNKQKEADFFAKNKDQEGLEELPSGVQILWQSRSDEGVQPEPTSKVCVHYRGTLLDGREFDSSYKRDKPLDFKLNQVIKGWQLGLQQMRVGDKATLYIPAHLAYGDRRVGIIEPASALIFEVELLRLA